MQIVSRDLGFKGVDVMMGRKGVTVVKTMGMGAVGNVSEFRSQHVGCCWQSAPSAVIGHELSRPDSIHVTCRLEYLNLSSCTEDSLSY